MSKVFSISMAMALMLMSLMGPMQPADVMDDAPQDPNPMAEEMPSDDTSETDDVVADEEDETHLPPTESEEVTVNEEDLTPAEEPSENANSPPAEDESVVEEEPLAENDEVISPNAVDPNPGDCPVDEICDGGGGGDVQTISVSFAAIGVVEGSEVPLTHASIEVRDDANVSLGVQVAGDDGVALFDLTVGKTYRFSMHADGYKSVTLLPVTITANMAPVTYFLEAVPGAAMFTVLDASTNQPVEFASVMFTDDPYGDYQSETNENGFISFWPLDAGSHSFTVSHPGYAAQEVIVTITPGQEVTITVHLVPAGDEWVITVTNKVTGAPVGSASIWIENNSTGDQFSGSTNGNGVWTSPRIADGLYIITVDHDDFVTIDHATLIKRTGTPGSVQMQPYLEGQIALTVIDSETDEPIADAQITVWYSIEPVLAEYGKTNADGKWTSSVLPGGEHQMNVHADGYTFKRATVAIVDGTTSLEVKLQPQYYGNFSFKVLDKENNQPIADANVTISLRGGVFLIGSGLTDADGNWQGPTTGWAEYQYTIEKHGFKTEQNIVFIQGKPFTRTIYLERGMSHDVSVSVNMPANTSSTLMVQPVAGMNPSMMPVLHAQATQTLVAVPGALVTLIDPYTNELLYSGETDEDGTVIISDVFEGRYRMVITAPSMQTYTQGITVGDGSAFEITMNPAQTAPPTDPDPGDGDGDDDTPTNPDPGDGDDATPTNPDPGTPGGNSNPDPGTPGGNPNPDNGTPGGNSNPGTGGESGQDVDNDLDVEINSPETGAVAQDSGSPSDVSTARVSELPNTGVGESNSHIGIAALTLVAAFSLLSALGIRRRI